MTARTKTLSAQIKNNEVQNIHDNMKPPPHHHHRSFITTASTMRTIGCALAALHARDPIALDKTFNYLTLPSLISLEQDIMSMMTPPTTTTKESLVGDDKEDHHNDDDRDIVLAKAMIRRIVHKTLQSKFAKKFTSQDIEDALKYHTLPQSLQNELYERYNNNNQRKTSSSSKKDLNYEGEKEKDLPLERRAPPPKTWFEVLEQLKFVSNNDSVKLWKFVLDNPITSYQPMQCQNCGYIVPDCIGNDDTEIGLYELEPTGLELEIRGGWFRGKPHGPKLFGLSPCPSCGCNTTIWYRSGHPQIILNPNRWGRLCGEQEDIRMMLADYLRIPIRLIIPLDWDHVWSEFSSCGGAWDNNTNISTSSSIDQQQQQQQVVQWEVHDDNARNFALRLEEGIGSWTRILAIHPDPKFCEDITDEYLKYQSEGGRVDDRHNNNNNNSNIDGGGENRMDGYRQIIEIARKDISAKSTQAKTLNGYVLDRANFTSERITNEMRRAVKDYYENISWWEL